MYKYVNGVYTNDCCSKQKTARLDPEIVRQKQGQEESENGRSDVHTSIF